MAAPPRKPSQHGSLGHGELGEGLLPLVGPRGVEGRDSGGGRSGRVPHAVMVERVEAGATLALHHTTMVQALPLHHYTMVQATEAGGRCRTLVYLARIGWTAVD